MVVSVDKGGFCSKKKIKEEEKKIIVSIHKGLLINMPPHTVQFLGATLTANSRMLYHQIVLYTVKCSVSFYYPDRSSLNS